MSFPALLFHSLQIWALSSFLNRCYGKFCRHFTLLPTSILLKPDFYQSNFIRVPIFWSKNNKSIVIFSKGFRQNKTIMISGRDVVPTLHHTISFRILSLIVVYRSQQKENIKIYNKTKHNYSETMPSHPTELRKTNHWHQFTIKTHPHR